MLTESQQNEVLSALYRDLGLTRVRLGIAADVDKFPIEPENNGRFDFTWKRCDAHYELAVRERAFGLQKTLASPGQREAWMGVSTDQDVRAYSDWLFALVQRGRQLGEELNYLSVSNEPSYGLNQMSGEFIRDVIKNLGPRLRANGFATQFLTPDDLNATVAFQKSSVILADPEARQYIGAIATHLYGGEYMSGLPGLSQQYGIPVWMTEYSRAEERTDGLGWAELMHRLISKSNVSAIDYMMNFFGQWQNGTQLLRLLYDEGRAVGGGNVQYLGYEPDEAYYAFGHYSRFVRPGARRILVDQSDPSLEVTAFQRDSTLVIVVINGTGAAKKASIETKFPGLQKIYGIRTAASQKWARIPDPRISGTGFAADFPERSITTFTTDLSALP